MSKQIWTDDQRNRLLEWAEAESVDDDEIINAMITKPEFTKADLDYLRQFPGFSSVEAQIVPTTNEKLADKIASEYSSIDAVPKAYLIDMQKQGLTDADLEKAFAKRDKQKKYDTMIAEQEQRKKDLEEASELSKNKSLAENALALALKLTPKEADRYFIRHGIKNGGSILDNLGLVRSAILGQAANIAELLPNPLISTITSPILRKTESALSGEKYDLTDEGLEDLALNLVSQAPYKKLGELAKGIAGRFLPQFEKTAFPGKLDKLADELDIASQGPKAIENQVKLQKEMLAKYKDIPYMDKLRVERTAREMESNGFPEMAKAAREYNVTKNVGTPIKVTEDVAEELVHPNIYSVEKPMQEKLLNSKTGKPIDMSKTWSKSTLRNRQAAIDKAIANSPTTKTKFSAFALDYAGRPVVRYVTNPEMDSNMIKQWEAGFIPKEGTDLYEQYMIWKQNKENRKEENK